MMNKVFVCVDDWQFDSGDTGCEVKVFAELEKALEWLKNAKSDAISDICGFLNADEIESEEGDRAFSIWEEGEYCYNHIDLTILEKEIL